MRTLSLLSILLAMVAAPSALHAQEEEAPRFAAGGHLLFANPVGEFGENVDFGFGGGLFGSLPLDEEGTASLRLDLGFLNYGRETIQICITQPCRVTGDLTTSNNIFLLGFGPEFGFGSGPLRVYGNASIGFAYFATTSSVEGENNDGDPFAEDTNFDDITFAWASGPGAQLRVYRGDSYEVSLDFFARFQGNGEARYLRKGDIIDVPGGVELDIQQSDTNFWSFGFGVVVRPPLATP